MRLQNREYDDFAYDARCGKRLKRKHFDLENIEFKTSSRSLKKALEDDRLGDGLVDDDYKKFLMQVSQYSEQSCSIREEEDNDGDDKDDEDTPDPQYNMFMQKVKGDGKSYVLEVAKDNGKSVFIKYEAEYVLDDEYKQNRRRLRNATDGGNVKAAKDSRHKPVNHCATNGYPDQKLSPECGPDGEGNPQARKKPRNAKKGKKEEIGNGLRNVTIPSKGKLENRTVLRRNQRKERHNPVVDKDLRFEPENPISCGTNKCSNQKLTRGDNNISEPKRMFYMKNDMVDESYRSFLDSLKVEGDCLVSLMKNGKVIYEDVDSENSSDLEILVTDDVQVCNEGNYCPFVPSREYDVSCQRNPSKKVHSQFREKVMVILKKPYDQDEYEKLLQDVEVRNPVEGRRNLRKGTKSYKKDRCGKSYLDHYSDLKQKVSSVCCNQHKVLNILRGFFFWLQNLSHEGAFRPWKDPACLAVMPGFG